MVTFIFLCLCIQRSSERERGERQRQRKMKVTIVLFAACVASLRAAAVHEATTTVAATTTIAPTTTTAAPTTNKPARKADTTTPAGGDDTTTPAGGDDTTTPAGGDDTTTPAGTTTPATIVCPEGWIDASVSDLGCLYFAEAGLSWFDTQSLCEGYQGFSAEALTMSQAGDLFDRAKLTSTFTGKQRWWLGLSDFIREGVWHWS